MSGPEVVRVPSALEVWREAPQPEALVPSRGTYRGWSIHQGRWPEPEWMAVGPDFDASYEGEEDGWVSNGQSADAPTFEMLIAEIDIWFEENAA